jgi:TPR repeat protein
MKNITLIGFLCMLTILPWRAEACGWWGDGDDDDSDDVVWVGDEWKLIPDKLDTVSDPQIQTRIATRYRTGTDVAKNYTEAVHWYRKAAEQGYAGAQNNLAIMYEQGLGVTKDQSEAIKWYRKAAEGQNPHAQHSLGRIYREGQGVPRDFTEAAKWILKSAEQGHHGAFNDIGKMYWKGLGVSQNNVLAYMWWKLGTMYGDKESERLCRMAAAKMTSGNVAKAANMALEWMPKK